MIGMRDREWMKLETHSELLSFSLAPPNIVLLRVKTKIAFLVSSYTETLLLVI